jgi:DnaD/phage-associated family protein
MSDHNLHDLRVGRRMSSSTCLEGANMGIGINDNLAISATCISNEFIDHYMADASGDAIKVYLYLLRHGAEQFEVSAAADALNLTDNDIERAVRYWEKKSVLASGAGQAIRTRIREEEYAMTDEEREYELEEERLTMERMAAEKLTAEKISMDRSSAEKAPISRVVVGYTDTAVKNDAQEMQVPVNTVNFSCDLEEVKDDEEFAGILFVAKHVLPSLPSVKQVETLAYMYKCLNMSADLIEYLLEYCADKKKTTYQYMDSVANNWHEEGIVTVRQAKEHVKAFAETANTNENKTERRPKVTRKPNRFLNLEQADVDYDLIARQKVMDRMKNGTE